MLNYDNRSYIFIVLYEMFEVSSILVNTLLQTLGELLTDFFTADEEGRFRYCVMRFEAL